MIPQDRSATAIELERVLDDLLPLLRTIQPAKLNATLNALATALDGRGDAARATTSSWSTATSPRSTPSCRPSSRTSAGWPTSATIYADAAPDLLQMLRNFSVTDERRSATRRPSYAGFLAGTAGFATTTRQLLERERRPDHPARRGRPADARASSPSTRPEYPCLLHGLAAVQRLHRQSTFANGELHITLEVTPARSGKYKPGDEPPWGENRGPELLRPAEPAPAEARQPLPATARAATASAARPAASCSTRRPALPAPRRSSEVVDALVARRWACRPTRCPTSRRCSSGRWPAARW